MTKMMFEHLDLCPSNAVAVAHQVLSFIGTYMVFYINLSDFLKTRFFFSFLR